MYSGKVELLLVLLYTSSTFSSDTQFKIHRMRTTHLNVTFPLCCPKFRAPESSIDWALTHRCQEYKEGPGSSSENHRACDDRTCGSFLRVIDTIGQQILLHNLSRTEGVVVGDILAIRKAKRAFFPLHDFPELSNF